MMQEKDQLSILIPVYNANCVNLVRQLQQQAVQAGIDYEIIVADDASPLRAAVEPNQAINSMSHCRFVTKECNTGSAATRNFLAHESRYRWLLFVDCDIEIADSRFISRYLSVLQGDVVSGGIAIGGDATALQSCLRYRYERHEAPNHSAAMRQQRPYRSFRSVNFIIRRDVMLACPFDERFKRSGYEDVLLGKRLHEQGFTICHIDNPVVMTDYEANSDYVVKTERSLHTLHEFRDDLRGYSRLLTFADGIHVGAVKSALRLGHRLFGAAIRHNLCGRHPSLRLFTLYKIGYYLNIKD